MTIHEFDARHDDLPPWLKSMLVELKGAVDTLRQKTFDDDDKHEAGHTRLRHDYRSLEGRMTAAENGHVADSVHLARIDEALAKVDQRLDDPVEVSASALRFTPGMVVAIVAVCASILGGAYGVISSTSGIRSDVRDLATMMASQAVLEQERNKNTMLQVVQLGDKVAALRDAGDGAGGAVTRGVGHDQTTGEMMPDNAETCCAMEICCGGPQSKARKAFAKWLEEYAHLSHADAKRTAEAVLAEFALAPRAFAEVARVIGELAREHPYE